jgi:hypothetical protein
VDWSVTGRLAGGSIPPTILTLFALYILGIKGNASPPLITTDLGIALVTHDGTPKQFQYVDTAYWQFQLNTAFRDADGIVLWGPSRFNWDKSSGWWAATLEFIRQVGSAKAPV